MRGSQKLYFAVQLDPDRVRQHLPEGLNPSPDGLGILSAFRIGSGDVGAWSGAVMGVAVNGHDSPTGMQAVYWTCVYADGAAHGMMTDYFSADAVVGSAQLRLDGDRVFAHAWAADGSGEVEAVMRITGSNDLLFDGAYHYMGADSSGSARLFTVIGHDRHVIGGEMESMTIAPRASRNLAALTPTKLNWGVYHYNVDLVMGAPRRVDATGDETETEAARGLLLAAFDHQKRPALVVDTNGIVLMRNGSADIAFAGTFFVGMRLTAGLRAGRESFERSLQDVRNGATVADPIALVLDDDRRAIATVTRLDPRTGGGGAFVVLSFPQVEPIRETIGLLRLLGLTDAEARIAAQVGSGLPTRSAADELGIAEATAKSTLKTVFDKLGIARRSELARLVARLELI